MKSPFKNRTTMRAVALFILTGSVFTFALPKEFFDPHMGIDYDVYCRLYDASRADSFILEAPSIIFCAHEEDLPQAKEQFRPLYINSTNEIRGPPLPSGAEAPVHIPAA
mgnify:CR=1 FL=1